MRGICGVGGLRHGEPGILRPLGAEGRDLVPHRRILLRLPQGGTAETDAEYVEDLWKLLDGRKPTVVLVDPSAASFIEALRRTGLRVQRADNDVLSGIRMTAGLLKEKRIVLCSNCTDRLREMELYCWDGREGRDAPRKEHDHAMDEMRYFAAYLAGKEDSGGFFAAAVTRKNA